MKKATAQAKRDSPVSSLPQTVDIACHDDGKNALLLVDPAPDGIERDFYCLAQRHHVAFRELLAMRDDEAQHHQ